MCMCVWVWEHVLWHAFGSQRTDLGVGRCFPPLSSFYLCACAPSWLACLSGFWLLLLSLLPIPVLAFWLFATISDSYTGLGDWTSGCQPCTGSVFAHIFNLTTYWKAQNWFHMVGIVIDALMIKTMKCLINILTDGLLHHIAILY